jgi:hypothetical protein
MTIPTGKLIGLQAWPLTVIVKIRLAAMAHSMQIAQRFAPILMTVRADRPKHGCQGDKMNAMNGIVRLFVVGPMLLIAQAIPAFAEKVDLMCPAWENHGAYYFTIDTEVMTVKDEDGTHPAQITADEVRWFKNNDNSGLDVRWYVRQSASLHVNVSRVDSRGFTQGVSYRWDDCVRITTPRPF